MRVFTYCRGRKVCAGCGHPLEGVRRDAVAHPECGRERRRKLREGQARPSGSRARARGSDVRQRAAEGVSCPRCGARNLLVRVLVFGPLVDASSVRIDQGFTVSGGKYATCTGCEWRGTVARARAAA